MTESSTGIGGRGGFKYDRVGSGSNDGRGGCRTDNNNSNKQNEGRNRFSHDENRGNRGGFGDQMTFNRNEEQGFSSYGRGGFPNTRGGSRGGFSNENSSNQSGSNGFGRGGFRGSSDGYSGENRGDRGYMKGGFAGNAENQESNSGRGGSFNNRGGSRGGFSHESSSNQNGSNDFGRGGLRRSSDGFSEGSCGGRGGFGKPDNDASGGNRGGRGGFRESSDVNRGGRGGFGNDGFSRGNCSGRSGFRGSFDGTQGGNRGGFRELSNGYSDGNRGGRGGFGDDASSGGNRGGRGRFRESSNGYSGGNRGGRGGFGNDGSSGGNCSGRSGFRGSFDDNQGGNRGDRRVGFGGNSDDQASTGFGRGGYGSNQSRFVNEGQVDSGGNGFGNVDNRRFDENRRRGSQGGSNFMPLGEKRNGFDFQMNNVDSCEVITEINVDGFEVKKMETWEDAEFPEPLNLNLKRCRYEKPRNIQCVALPFIIDGYDVKAQVETGSGKTAAFLLSIIDSCMRGKALRTFKSDVSSPFAIIIAPTRELVLHIYEQAEKFAKDTGVSVIKTFEQCDINLNHKEIRDGCDILCGTPGRLKHYIKQGDVLVKNLKFLVLEEADQLLGGQFNIDIEEITNMPSFPSKDERQTLLFCSTFHPQLMESTNDLFKSEPVYITFNKVHTSKDPNVQKFLLKVTQSYDSCSEIEDSSDDESVSDEEENELAVLLPPDVKESLEVGVGALLNLAVAYKEGNSVSFDKMEKDLMADFNVDINALATQHNLSDKYVLFKSLKYPVSGEKFLLEDEEKIIMNEACGNIISQIKRSTNKKKSKMNVSKTGFNKNNGSDRNFTSKNNYSDRFVVRNQDNQNNGSNFCPIGERSKPYSSNGFSKNEYNPINNWPDSPRNNNFSSGRSFETNNKSQEFEFGNYGRYPARGNANNRGGRGRFDDHDSGRKKFDNNANGFSQINKSNGDNNYIVSNFNNNQRSFESGENYPNRGSSQIFSGRGGFSSLRGSSNNWNQVNSNSVVENCQNNNFRNLNESVVGSNEDVVGSPILKSRSENKTPRQRFNHGCGSDSRSRSSQKGNLVVSPQTEKVNS